MPLPAQRRWIAHLDMDAFYASVELLRYPELRGQPVVIGGGRRHQPRTARPTARASSRRCATTPAAASITTATYEARAFGVHSGDGADEGGAARARRDPAADRLRRVPQYSRLFKAAVRRVAPQIEDRGIDEIYIDLTDVPGAHDAVGHDPFGGVRAIALDIKDSGARATGLSCSIGVTPNKLLAKIASELDKPDGLTMLTHDDVPTRIWPLPARKHQRHRAEGQRASSSALGIDTHRRARAARPGTGWSSIRPQLRRAGCTRRRTAATTAPVVTDERAQVDQPRDHVRARPARRCATAPSCRAIFTELCEQLARRPAAQGLRRAHDRHQAALRQLQDGDARPDAAAADAATRAAIRRAAGECLKRVRPRAAHPAARRARRHAGACARPAVAPIAPGEGERECSPSADGLRRAASAGATATPPLRCRSAPAARPRAAAAAKAAHTEPSAIITVASCLARSGTARRSRQSRTIGPKRGCSSSQRSQRSLPREKQSAASSTNGVVGSSGTTMPTTPVTSDTTPAAAHSRRCHLGRVGAATCCMHRWYRPRQGSYIRTRQET